jgi:glycosyltransferase involved in cell wall biosynthesis
MHSESFTSISRQKVSIFVPSMGGGGAEKVMMLVANGLAQRGLSVDLVLTSNEGPYLKDVSKDVRIVNLNSRRVITSTPLLARYLRLEHPQVLLSALTHANVIAVWARQYSRIPMRLVLSEHGVLTARRYFRQRERLIPWLMRCTYPNADRIVAVSGGVADDIASSIGLPRECIQVIYNPVVTDDMIALSNAPLQYAWFDVGEPPVVLAAGRLSEQKDFPTLIHAFHLIRKRRFVRLVILGEGEKRGELEDLIAQLRLTSDVRLPGYVDNPFAWMRKSAVFVLSSAWEGLGNVLIEAMACGTQVVSTDCPSGPAEILENGKWGRLVPVGDSSTMAQAIEAALDNPGIDPHERGNFFSVSRAVDKYMHVLGLM